MSEILEYMNSHRASMEAFLRTLVEYESPSLDKAALDRLALFLADQLKAIDGTVHVIDNSSGGNHLRAGWQAFNGKSSKQVLMLSHFDTVWPVGEVQNRPFHVEGGKAFGPGVVDMKGGIVAGYYAIKCLLEVESPRPRVVWLLNSDEEIYSVTSRQLIESAAEKSDYVLCLEPARQPNSLTTFRKGVGDFKLEITGRAAHAGADPEKGVSAIRELALQILQLHELSDLDKGITVNVGVISGGNRPNIVAPDASALIDLRFCTPGDGERIAREILNRRPNLTGAEVNVTGRINRPPMVSSADTASLFEQARIAASKIGSTLTEARSGGGSDANFSAAIGIPTLCGLGPVGQSVHAVDECLDLSSLPFKAALIAELLGLLI